MLQNDLLLQVDTFEYGGVNWKFSPMLLLSFISLMCAVTVWHIQHQSKKEQILL